MIYLLIFFSIPLVFWGYGWVYDHFFFPKEVIQLRGFLEQKKLLEAHQVLKKIWKRNRENPEVLLLSAQLNIEQKQWYLALFDLDKIIARKNFSPTVIELEVRVDRMKTYKALKKFNQMMTECQSILALDEDHLEANLELGKRLFEMKNYQGAENFLEKIVHRTDDAGTLEMLLDVYLLEEKYREAEVTVERLINQFDQPHCRILHKKTKVDFYLERYEKALEVAESIDEVYQKPPDLKLIEAICSYRIGKLEKAYRIFNPLLKSYIDDDSELILKARYFHTKLLIEHKDLPRALDQMKFIKEVNRSDEENSNRLKCYHQILNQPFLKEFFQSYPNEQQISELVIKMMPTQKKWNSLERFNDLPFWQLHHFKERNKPFHGYVLFSFTSDPLGQTHLRTLVEKLNLVAGETNQLLVLTLFPIKEMDFKILTDLFKDHRQMNGKEMLDQMTAVLSPEISSRSAVELTP